MKFFLSTLCAFCLFLTGFSQGEVVEHVIQSKAFGKERKVYVHLPQRYVRNAQDTFMVVYVLDAQSPLYWNMAKSNISYLVDNYQVVPMIAVGIHSDSRQKEFIPLKNGKEAGPDNIGQSHLLQQHLRAEVIPLVDSLYRVNKLRAVVGHSRGGAFVSGTLFSDQSDLFDAYVGISPGMAYVDRQILKQAAKHIQEGIPSKKFLYCSYGTVGSIDHYFEPQVNYLDSLVFAHPNPSFAWEKKVIEGGSHWTCVLPSWNDALIKMSQHFGVDQQLIQSFGEKEGVSIKSQAMEHLAHREKNFGYAWAPRPGDLRYYGNEFDEMGKPERALEMYLWTIELDPNDFRALQGIGWLHRQQKKFKEAKLAYEKALKALNTKKEEFEQERYARMRRNIEGNIQEIESSMD